MSAKPVVRLTVNLSPEAAEALKKLASTLDTNQTTALHQAIMTSAVLQDEVQKGNTVLIEDKHHKEMKEVRLKRAAT